MKENETGSFREALLKTQKNLYTEKFTSIRFPVLTIDSSMHDRRTKRLLRILKKHGCHATFFLCGQWTEKYSKHIPDMEEIGCEIANHSYNHPPFTDLSFEEIKEQLSRTQALNEKATGNAKMYFRFPFGQFTTRELAVVRKEGYDIFQWSLDTIDWKAQGVTPILQKLAEVKPGDIVLIHNDGKYTAKALDQFLSRREKEGNPVSFLTITEALTLVKSIGEQQGKT